MLTGYARALRKNPRFLGRFIGLSLAYAVAIAPLYGYFADLGNLTRTPGLVTSVVLALMFILAILTASLRRQKFGLVGLPAVVALAYVATSLLVHQVFLTDIAGFDVGQIVFFHWVVLIFHSFYFLLGLRWDEGLDLRMLLIPLWLVFATLMALGVDAQKTITLSVSGQVTYLYLADSFAVLSTVTIAAIRSRSLSILGLIASILILYLIGSRSSLYAFSLASLILVLVEVRAAFREGLQTRAVLLVLSLVSLSVMAFIYTERLSGTRMFEFLYTGRDSSWEARVEGLSVGLETILEAPILGSFGSDVRYFGEIGNYIHNYLEVYRQFGLVPFLLIVVAIGLSIRVVYRRLDSLSGERRKLLVFLGSFTVLSVISARSWAFSYIFLSIGLCAAASLLPRRSRSFSQGSVAGAVHSSEDLR